MFKRIRLNRYRKFIAVFLLMLIANQLISPSVAWALTAGPTSPEATSFEPIDTTDIVNPLTGSFTYNVPLLEVPGPEGGYPLSLSYHASIQPGIEASWVGLGWTLNPGAITRNVNGYPDDWNGVQNVSRSYWSGGETKTLSVNVGFGLGAATVNLGLAFAQDTYRGFGIGYSIGAGIGFQSSPLGIGATVGVSPYGQPYAGVNIGIVSGKSGLVASANIGISTNFDGSASVGAGAGIGFSNGHKYNASLLGASISSSGGKASLTVGGGATSVNNSREGTIQTRSWGGGFFIPTPIISLGVSYTYTRYWSDETVDVATNGVLYSHPFISTTEQFNNIADDNYHLSDSKFEAEIDPQKQVGGTYPNFDNYSVTAQGLGGNMRPYKYMAALYTQNVKNDNNRINNIDNQYVDPGTIANNKWNFRFINDFSNSYRQSPPTNWNYSYAYNFNTGSITYGNNDNDYSYDAPTNRLEGSEHIEYFTNNQILSGSFAKIRGFVDCDAEGFTRPANDQIGGFMITNASGVTYHYALPAYAVDAVTYMEKIDHSSGNFFNKLTKNDPYAYTWYLTAITGPDYVSQGESGKIHDNDWGYWIKFDYGKWTDKYQWRNPNEGFHRDVDNDFQDYSAGIKEVYYLDAVRTRSHTAVFEKEIRADAKSGNYKYTSTTDGLDFHAIAGRPSFYPRASLRLNNIYLFNNEDIPSLNTIRTASTNYNFAINYSRDGGGGTIGDTICRGKNIIDKYDLDQTLKDKCIRKIAFNYDYSLTPGTPNSYDPGGGNTYIAAPDPSAADYTLGKLTLLSVDFQGKAGASTTPPLKFQYDYDPTDPKNVQAVQLSNYDPSTRTASVSFGSAGNEASKFSIGDIVKSGNTYAVLINGNTIRYLPGSPTTGFSTFTKTNNPPYNADAYDIWGCYKADFIASSNETFSRTTSEASGKAADAWSLMKIQTSLGSDITINYDSNTYSKSVLNKNNSIIVTGGHFNTDNTQLILDIDNPGGIDLNSLLNGKTIIPTLDIRDSIETDNSVFSVARHYRDVILNSRDDSDIQVSADDNRAISKNYSGFTVYSVNNNQVTLIPKDVSLTTIINDALTASGLPGTPSNCSGCTLSSPSGIAIMGGNIGLPNSGVHYGGGIRVKNVITNDFSNPARKVSYGYSTPYDPSSTSGITSYEPITLNNDKINYISDAERQLYHKVQNRDVNYLMSIAREAPAPGVMYEYVTVHDSNILPNGTEIDIPGLTMYQYEVFNSSMLGIYDYYRSVQTVNSLAPYDSRPIRLKKRAILSIKDYTAKIGNLKRIVTYSDNNGTNKITEKINHYLGDDVDDLSFEDQVSKYEPQFSAYNYLGIIQEMYGNARYNAAIMDGNNIISWDDLFVMSGKETYPSIQTGITQIDYKNGVTIDQKNLAYDYYNGQVAKTLTTDSYGNRFISETTPAYRKYPYMGLRTHDASVGGGAPYYHKNMLTQEATNTTYSVDASNNPIGIINATAQTWSTSIPALTPDGVVTEMSAEISTWRQQASYQWMPVGVTANNTTPYSSFVDYFSTGGSSNANWKKVQENTLYNVYSNALEGTDINNLYSATHMGYKNSKVIVTGGPARYNELAFASVEDDLMTNGNFTTNVSPGSGIINIDTTYAHTGVKSLKVASGQQGFTYTVSHTNLSAKDYNVALWVKPSAGTNINTAALFYQSNGGTVMTPTQTYSKSAAGWYLLEARIPASAIPTAGSLIVGCKNTGGGDLYFDDFRFQPYQSAVTAYVYDRHTGELTYVIDNSNLFTRYQYDAAGKLIRTYREVLGKTQVPLVSVNKYHYARSGGTSTGEYFPTMSIGQSSHTSPVAGFWANDGGGGPSTTYLWNFGDGTTSTSQTGSHDYANPGLYTVTLTVNNPTYGSQVITKQLRIVTIELQEESGTNVVVAVVNGIDLNTCQTFWVEKYCDYSPSMGPGCDMDFVPWVTYEDTYHPYNTYHDWTDSNETLEDFIATDQFYFMITDGYGHTYQSDLFQ